MQGFISRLISAAQQFKVLDFTLFKICLCALGILLGVYFHTLFEEYIVVVWCCFAISYAVLLVQLFRYARKKRD